jgi:hypothetical protein
MHPAFLRLFTDTVQHAAYAGQDAYGKPNYATPVSRSARVEYKVRRVVDATGQERVSRSRVFLDGDVTIDMRDQLVLSDGTRPPILVLYSPKDLDGNVSHHEVSL